MLRWCPVKRQIVGVCVAAAIGSITGVGHFFAGNLFASEGGSPITNGAAIDKFTANGTMTRFATGLVEPVKAAVSPTARLGNISTRLRVETGDNVLIGGFIVTGMQPKKVIIRAIGPSLPYADKLANPTLELRDSSGALIRSNDSWRNDQEAEIIATGIPPTNDAESAIVETLDSGAAYTAILAGAGGGTGIALVEAYALNY